MKRRGGEEVEVEGAKIRRCWSRGREEYRGRI